MNPTRRGALALVGAAAVTLAACGGSSSSSPTPRPTPTAATPTSTASTPTPTAGSTAGSTATTVGSLEVRPESAAASQLPAVVVRQVQTDTEVQLKNLLPAAKPLLVWFWAPH